MSSSDELLNRENSRLLLSNTSPYDLEGAALRDVDGSNEQDIELDPISFTEPLQTFPKSHARQINAPRSNKLRNWLQGPQPPRPFRISPILARIQYASLSSFQRKLPTRKQRSLLYTFLCFVWIGCFSVILSASLRGCHIPEQKNPIRLACISRPW